MPKASIREILLWLIRRRSRHVVRGESMEPLLKNGQEVLVHRKKKVKSGDIAIVAHPYKKINLIKKIKSTDETGAVEIEGINKNESEDSRTFGKISGNKIIGKVTSTL